MQPKKVRVGQRRSRLEVLSSNAECMCATIKTESKFAADSLRRATGAETEEDTFQHATRVTKRVGVAVVALRWGGWVMESCMNKPFCLSWRWKF